MKKLLFIAGLLSAVLCLSSCGNKKVLTLVMAEMNPADSVVGMMDDAFAKKVAELSKGKIIVDVQYSGVLGDETKVMDIVRSKDPSIAFARVSASLASYGGEKSKLITIPFTFNNEEHFWKFAHSDIAKEILNEPYEKGLGVKGVFYGEEGFRHFFATEKITSIEDMKDKNVRVSSAKVMQDLVHSVGGNPVTVAFTNLYSSMMTGQTDVADQPISNYLSNSFFEVAPYVIMDGHMLGAVQVVISSSVWDSLDAKQQQILLDAGSYASDFCQQTVSAKEQSVIDELKSKGVTIVEVSDKSPWQNACKDMIAESSSSFPEVYEQIRNIGK